MKFNDASFQPSIRQDLKHLSPDFENLDKLIVGNHIMTEEKCKDMLRKAKPKIVDIIERYELSGNGGGQRDTDAPDWGSFDITLCTNGDDQTSFLKSPRDAYLLYWWTVLNEYQLLQFTAVRLPDFMLANTSSVQEVSRLSGRKQSPKEEDIVPQYKLDMIKSVSVVGKGVDKLADIEIEKEIETWESTLFELEPEWGQDDPGYPIYERKTALFKNQIKALQEKINDYKKRRAQNVTEGNSNSAKKGKVQ